MTFIGRGPRFSFCKPRSVMFLRFSRREPRSKKLNLGLQNWDVSVAVDLGWNFQKLGLSSGSRLRPFQELGTYRYMFIQPRPILLLAIWYFFFISYLVFTDFSINLIIHGYPTITNTKHIKAWTIPGKMSVNITKLR